jgi:hypothetical protein
MEWLLTKGKFSLKELHQLSFGSSTISKNINSFLRNRIQRAFIKRKGQICAEVLVCREDRELTTKSEIIVLTRLFSLLTLAMERVQLQGQDSELEEWVGQCLRELEGGLSPDKALEPTERLQHSQQFLVEVAIYVILAPQLFKLQLLVEDRELETALRRHA